MRRSYPQPASGTPQLQHVALTTNNLTENSGQGTRIGQLLNLSAGVVPVLSNNALGKVQLTGPDGSGNYFLEAGATNYDFDTAGASFPVAFTQTNAGFGNSPLSTTLNVQGVNVYEAAFLGALTLSATTFVKGTSASGAINGASAGSTIVLTNGPTGLTINSGARTWSYDGSGNPSTGNLVLTETLADSANSGRQSTIAWQLQINLSALTLSSSTFVRNVPSSGSINGATAGSTISASGLPNGLSIDGPNRTWNWDGSGLANTGNLVLTETLDAAANSGRQSTIGWTVGAGVTLGTLALDATAWAIGTPASGAITGATASSVLSTTGLPAGLTINSGARTWAWDGVGDGNGYNTNFSLIETLAGAVGSPKSNTINYTVSIAPLSVLTIAFDSGSGWVSGQNPPAILITLPGDASVQVGDWYRFECANNPGFTSSAFSVWHQITSDDVINSIDFGGMFFTWGSELPSSGAAYFRATAGRGPDAAHITSSSGNSNTITDTLAAVAATVTYTDGNLNVGSTDKSKYLKCLSPDLQVVAAANVGAGLLERSNKPATVGAKFHIEFQLDGWNSNSASSSIFFGFDDRTIDFNVGGTGYILSSTNYPGSSGGAVGVLFEAKRGSSSLICYRNGNNGGLAFSLGAIALQAGDRFSLDVDPTATNPTMLIKHYRGGTVTSIGTLTVTSQKPAADKWWLIGGGKTGTGGLADLQSDIFTLKPNTSDWLVTPQPGFGIMA